MTRCRKIAKQTNMWANMSPERCEMCFAMITLKSRLLWSPSRLCPLLTKPRAVGLSRLDHERFLPCTFRFIIPHSCHQRCTFQVTASHVKQPKLSRCSVNCNVCRLQNLIVQLICSTGKKDAACLSKASAPTHYSSTGLLQLWNNVFTLSRRSARI